ncbi:GHMP kinase [Winogradskyella eckloniae]|nr:GHMP kinase [Winogradskyella eckloniae]
MIYRSNGKLLLTAEYAVLDGTKALAIPTAYGQSLKIEKNESNVISWKSFNEQDTIWYQDRFTIAQGEIKNKSGYTNDISQRLIQIFEAIKTLNPDFLTKNIGFNITTHQDFNRLWGLGTSSTLINNMANWGNVDAFTLLAKTFGGSGYDIACAQNNCPITFQLQDGKPPIVDTVNFEPEFKQHLYFVYLNQKQNSRDGISTYKQLGKINTETINTISSITEKMICSTSLLEFEKLIETHESIVSSLVQQKVIKQRLFKDFKGAIKSLGAWGGDFVLATSQDDPTPYFNSKGLDTIIPYDEMILKHTPLH